MFFCPWFFALLGVGWIYFCFPQNYNKSRIHSFRGVRLVDITLDDNLIFQGEIARYCLSSHGFGRWYLGWRCFCFLLLCEQLKMAVIISLRALRTYDLKLHFRTSHKRELYKQLSLGFTVYFCLLTDYNFCKLVVFRNLAGQVVSLEQMIPSGM